MPTALPPEGISGMFAHVVRREQERIGRDLHDDLGQHLSCLALMAKGVETKMLSGQLPQLADIQSISRVASESALRVRSIARALNPLREKPNALCAALRELTWDTQRISGAISTFIEPIAILVHDAGVANQLYKIAQESVSNAVAHAQPTRLQVMVEAFGPVGSSQLHLTIWNDCPKRLEPDGAGETPPSGMGLRSMAFRCASIGAQLRVLPFMRNGFEVRVVLPNGPAWSLGDVGAQEL
jgi:signal transduction histidine kinase